MSHMFTQMLIFSLVSFAAADLRVASWPKNGYDIRDQGTTAWNVGQGSAQMHAIYMEPSTFGYGGLQNQKNNNYDNFLRSNIDNEQDNRNFNNEDGMDHLPFRTANTQAPALYARAANRRRRGAGVQQVAEDLIQYTSPGQTTLVPLRWNNPHSSEMEVNIWIFQTGRTQPVVVPIRKPSCSGEGYQDNIVSFTIPTDFSKLGAKIPGFKGCNPDTTPKCTIQLYSHSVESRQYSIGFPIVIPGHDASLTTQTTEQIQKVTEDPWLQINNLRDVCLPATDPSATIATSQPRWARLVSDVYTHSYMNSDYSPYSGQQQESISKNLQTSAINKMEVGNRGELGKAILPQETKNRLNQLQNLEDKVYKNYEALANRIINRLGNRMQNTGGIGVQNLARCFRCAEAGSTNTNRLQTNTYIPSFQLPANLVNQARGYVQSKYQGLITQSGLVQIYNAAMTDLMPFFFQSRNLGIMYQPAAVKTTLSTMTDATQFRKRNANGQTDGGRYASTEAKKVWAASHGCSANCLFGTQNAQAAAKTGTYTTYANKNAYNGAGAQDIDRRGVGGMSAQQCQTRCNQDANCECVTYQPGANRCWKRTACNPGGFRNSGAFVVYVADTAGAANVDFAKPLVKGARSTSVSGACAPCAQFFGEGTAPLGASVAPGGIFPQAVEPPVSALAKQIAEGGLPSEMEALAPNPEEGLENSARNSPEIIIEDGGGNTAPAERRRRNDRRRRR